MHARLEDLEPVLALALGHVQRDVGAAQQFVGGLRPRRQDRDADARVDEQLLTAPDERGLQDGQQPPSDVGRRRDPGRDGRILDKDSELVAAHPRDRVPGAEGRAQALGDADQDGVALAVPQAVVDRLEVVEIDEEDRQRPRIALVERQGVVQPIDEERAVGKAGQRVMEGLVAELVLERLARGDVAVMSR